MEAPRSLQLHDNYETINGIIKLPRVSLPSRRTIEVGYHWAFFEFQARRQCHGAAEMILYVSLSFD